VRLAAARPRLLRITRSFRIPPDAADDVVQEALLAAWRHLDHLRSRERFDAWLDTICRNQCRMFLRAQRSSLRREPYRLDSAATDPDGDTPDPLELADPSATDPLASLAAQDIAILLDRALSSLPAHMRRILELHYLHGLPATEAAPSLGISVGVLEARLHRARKRLREVFTGPLRDEAAAFGLLPADTNAWQETRIWCHHCGQRRLLGIFATLPDGRRELRLRCPACSPLHGRDIIRSKGIAPLDGLRAFRPALTRTLHALADRTAHGLATGWDTCLHCGHPVRRRVVMPDEFPASLHPAIQRHWVVAACEHPGCIGLGAWPAIEPAIWFHPAAQHFMAQHPRWITAPEDETAWHGLAAIRFRLVDFASAARLTFIADAHTLRILATLDA
jgi:RNA polymerase sigma-70 factor (ECF subfamily)